MLGAFTQPIGIKSTPAPVLEKALKRSCDKKLLGVEKAKEETLRKIRREFDEKLRQKEVEVVRREKEGEVKIRYAGERKVMKPKGCRQIEKLKCSPSILQYI